MENMFVYEKDAIFIEILAKQFDVTVTEVINAMVMMAKDNPNKIDNYLKEYY